MTPWMLLDSTQVPGNGDELRLYQRGDEFSIKIADGSELMNSRVHGSEDALAEHSCARLVDCEHPRLLIGGLGMGFTLAAALRFASEQTQVEVAELVPTVVAWNKGPLGAARCAGGVVSRSGQSVYATTAKGGVRGGGSPCARTWKQGRTPYYLVRPACSLIRLHAKTIMRDK